MKNKILLIITLLLIPFSNVYALDYFTEDDYVCTETESHKKWSLLSEKEKTETIEPVLCEETIKYTTPIRINSSVGAINNVNYQTLSKFDLRNVNGVNYVSPLKEQGTTNLCWTFATTSAIESANLVEGNSPIELSQKHIAFNTTYKLSDGNNPLGVYREEAGWDYGMSLLEAGEYLSSGRGPVKESKVPWSSQTGTLALANQKADYYVNDILVSFDQNTGNSGAKACTAERILEIKYLLTNYGAVATHMYGGNNNNDPVNNYIFTNGNAYYYSGTAEANHAIVIVGWDDNYPKEKFSNDSNNLPSRDGAWIVKNTYGDFFPGTEEGLEEGYHYISYGDSYVCTTVLSVHGVTTDVSDNSYFYDTYNHLQMIRNDQSTTIFKEIFTKKGSSSEEITKVSLFTRKFATLSADRYEIYYSETDNLAGAKLILSGNVEDVGYHTFNISDTVINSNQFYIYYKYISSHKMNVNNEIAYYIPAEVFVKNKSLATNERVYRADVPSGVSYYSLDGGTTWNDTTTNDSLAFYPIIHVFTSNNSYNISSSSPVASSNKVSVEDGGYYDIPLTLTNISSKDDITVEIYDSNNQDVTNSFQIEPSTSGYKVAVKVGTTKAGSYKVVFKYEEISTSQYITVEGLNKILITKITVTGGNEVSVGGTLNLTASITPTNATLKDLTWASSDPKVATVNESGVVSGIKDGSVVISAISKDGSEVRGTISIKVINISGGTVSSSEPPASSGSQEPASSNSGSNQSNPQTGITQYILPFTIILIVGLAILIKSKKYNIFKKIK